MKDLVKNIEEILEHIGEDPTREGLKDTPKRVVKMYGEIFKGYSEENKPKITVFENKEELNEKKYDEMIIDQGSFWSMCEHHMLPFFGEYHFAYIPQEKLIGLSKIARIVDWYAGRLQVQERLTNDIVSELESALSPLGIALIMKGQHMCKNMRGVKKNGLMTTSDMRGAFRNVASARQEFLALIK